MRIFLACLLSVLTLTSPLLSVAQQGAGQQAELERRRAAILADIRESQAQLAETRKNKNASMAELRAAQARLNARMSLINNINEEIRNINGSISSSQQEIASLQHNLEGLKARYAQSVRYEYEHRSSYNMLAFLFSAKDYNTAVQRIKYLKRYRDYRGQQVAEIYQTQRSLGVKVGTLQQERSRHDALLTVEQQQRQVLESETRDKNQVVNSLKGQEKEIMASIKKNEKTAQQINRTVQALIARQIEEDRKRAAEERRREEARKKAEADRLAAARAASAGTYDNGSVRLSTGSGRTPLPPAGTAPAGTAATGSRTASEPAPASTGAVAATNARRRNLSAGVSSAELNMTPAARELSNNFAANKGRLPWPVDRGNIISQFGQHPHPVYKDVTVTNLGIDIQTPPGASAHAVFEGRVSSVVSIGGGAGTMVLLQHGEYYSVYNNLSGVTVKIGDNVRTRQPLGTVILNDENLPVMNFQIWKGFEKTNPAVWIAR